MAANKRIVVDAQATRKQDPQVKASVIRGNLCRAAIVKFKRKRLPNNEHGRDLLYLLLQHGMPFRDARRWAPWCSREEMDQLAEDADAVESHPEDIATLAKIPDKMRERYKLWAIRPCDVPWHVVKERKRQRKNQNNPTIKRNRKERLMQSRSDISRETSALLAIGPSTAWQSASIIAGLVGGGVAWRGLEGAALRMALKRTLDKLEKSGRIESMIRLGQNEMRTRFVRQKSASATPVTGTLARKLDSIGTSVMF
jgi:hypothetical protein